MSARRLVQAIARRAAGRYVVGPELDHALAKCRQLALQGFATTICAWNCEQSHADDNAARCLDGINAVASEQLDCHVSLKALDLGFSPCLIERAATSALLRDVRLHFDSMGPEVADETLSIVCRLSKVGFKPGYTIPGRWRRSLSDAELVSDLGLPVRVVKGQWPDPDEPQMDLRMGFRHVIDRLAGRARHVAVATHDPGLARAALHRLRESGTQCELELLFGMPLRAGVQVGHEMGVPIRIYVPYGHPWLPYALGQVRKNPGIAWRTLRDILAGYGPDANEDLRR